MRILPIHNLRYQGGFTLVELLVTTTIFVMLLAGAGLASRGAIADRTLEQTANSVQSAIYQARSLALAPETTRLHGSPGYRFLVKNNNYEVWELNSGNQAGSLVSSGTLPSGLSFVLPLTPSPFMMDFLILDQGKISTTSNDVYQLIVKRNDNQGAVRLTAYGATGQVEQVRE